MPPRRQGEPSQLAAQKKTGFDRHFVKRMADPKFAPEYASARTLARSRSEDDLPIDSPGLEQLLRPAHR